MNILQSRTSLHFQVLSIYFFLGSTPTYTSLLCTYSSYVPVTTYETFSHSLCQSSPGSATENTTIPTAVESSTILKAYSYAAVFSSYLTAFVATDLVGTKHDSNCIRLCNVVDVSNRGEVFVKFHYIKNCTISSWSYSDEHERQPNQRFTSSLESTQIGIGTHHKDRAANKIRYQYQS